ncbi:MAG: biotin/lipoyl-binding protein, partial [Acinetobacter sp.]|uniref:HlyD family secretion protein n=1 Tax=Acinetobacter sp. TaxID=472 RepID=UPI00199169A2
MSEDQKPIAPAETTATSEDASQPEQPVTATTPITPPSSKLIPTAKRTLILMFLVLIIGISIILWAWKIGPFDSAVESTDNSYVKGKTTVLSSQINGYVKDVLVSDFDHVKKGQVLMHIDATTYDQKVTQAEAGVDQAQNALSNQSQNIAQRKADIVAAEAKVEQARAAYQLSLAQQQRYQQLGDSGAASKSEQDKAFADTQNNLALLQQ